MKTMKVRVWGKPHQVTVSRKSKTVWIAVGEYMGQLIETKTQARAPP